MDNDNTMASKSNSWVSSWKPTKKHALVTAACSLALVLAGGLHVIRTRGLEFVNFSDQPVFVELSMQVGEFGDRLVPKASGIVNPGESHFVSTHWEPWDGGYLREISGRPPDGVGWRVQILDSDKVPTAVLEGGTNIGRFSGEVYRVEVGSRHLYRRLPKLAFFEKLRALL